MNQEAPKLKQWVERNYATLTTGLAIIVYGGLQLPELYSDLSHGRTESAALRVAENLVVGGGLLYRVRQSEKERNNLKDELVNSQQQAILYQHD